MNGGKGTSEPLAVTLYRRLLVLFPSAFRSHFGRDMAQLFGDVYASERAAGGRRGAALITLQALTDLLSQAARERLAALGPRWVQPLVLSAHRHTALREHPPSEHRGDVMQRMIQDFRQSLRSLVRRPALAATVVVLIALGIGLDVALYSVARATLMRPLPFPEPDRLVVLTGNYSGVPYWSLGVPELRDLAERGRVFGEVGIYSTGWPVTLTGAGPARSLTAGYASADFFRVLATPPALGRTFVPEEDDGIDAHPVAVLSHRFWQSEMAADPEAVGRKLDLGGRSYEVVGVLSSDFHFANQDVWLPLSMGTPAFGRGFHKSRPQRYHFGVARLPSAAALEEGRQELEAVMAQLRSEMPDLQRDRGVSLFTLREFFYGGVEQPVKLLLAGASLVLLICCVNVGALLLVRAIARRREMAVRTAMGASRWRLLRAFLAESLALTVLGGAFGILLAQVALRWIVTSFDLALPTFTRLEPDRTALGVALGLILVVALALGTFPALSQGLRGSLLTLRGGTRAGDRRTPRHAAAIIALEVALALILLIGSGLTAKSFMRLVGTDLGYDTRDLVTFRLDMRGSRFQLADAAGTAAARNQFADQVGHLVEALPGVESATFWGPAMLGAANMHAAFAPEGADFDDEDSRLFTQFLLVSPGSLAQLGIPLVEGRDLEASDRFEGPKVAVVDQSLARALFADGRAVGRRMYYKNGDEPRYITIVGIAHDARHRGRRNDDGADGVAGDVYLPFSQNSRGVMSLLVRTQPGIAVGSIAQGVLRAVASVDADVPVYDVATQEERLGRLASVPRFSAFVMAVYAGVAALLAFVGIYGTLAYTVRQRRTELAVRTALGADRGSLESLVMRQGLKPVVAGIAAGTLAALALARLAEGVLFGVEHMDPAVYVAVGVVVASASAVACYLPARRASNTAPAAVLHYD